MINKKATLSVLFVLALGLVISCNSTKLINENIGDNQITVASIQCGSYEVKSNEATIGYAVKPFIVEVDRVKKITEFERKLRIKYKNKFNKDYRIYTFTTDRAGDTILMTLFLSSKQVENNPNWKCQLQEVQIYPKRSEWFFML
ncbi:hypothetical protein [Sinomicrobium sp. M5D2P9]